MNLRMTKIYELPNHILIHTGYQDPGVHRHMAAHIIISTLGKICVSADGEEYLCSGVMIPSGVSHSVDTYGNPALVFLFDSTTNAAKQIENVQTICEEDATEIVCTFDEFEKNSSRQTYDKIESYILKLLSIDNTVGGITDDRIVSAMKYIREKGNRKITCREAAESVFLSESRFSHLFRKEAGMTFAAYLIYQRIINVYTGSLQGKSITEAALDAGFASSSHFADVNRRVFGISVSDIARDLEYQKVI